MALVGLLLAHLAVNATWISRDLSLRAMDMGCHLGGAARFHAEVLHRGLEGLIYALRGDLATNWPAASYLPWALGAWLTGPSVPALRLLNMVYLGVLLGAVYLVGRRLLGPWTGVLAAAICSLYPGIYGAARQFGADLPGAAVTAFGVAVLLASDGFGRLRLSLWLGAVVGFGVLVRPMSLLMVAPPVALALGLGLWRPGVVPRARRLLHLCLVIGAVLAVSAVWWLGRAGQIAGTFMAHALGDFADIGGDPGGSLHYLSYLPDAAGVVLLLVAAAAVAALAWWWWRRARRGDPGQGPEINLVSLVVVIAWLVAGLLTISLIGHRFTRYVFPLLPALALVSAAGLGVLPSRVVRRLATGALLVVSGASLLYCSFNWGTQPRALRGGLPSSPCVQCGDWAYGGPPAIDGYYTVALEVARQLRRRHGDGRHVLVQFRCYADLLSTITSKAVLTTELPRVTLTAMNWEDYAAGHSRRVVNISAGDDDKVLDDLYLPIMGVPYAGPFRPVRHCYVLRLSQNADGPVDPEGDDPVEANARRQLIRDAASFSGATRFELWRLKTCPAVVRRQPAPKEAGKRSSPALPNKTKSECITQFPDAFLMRPNLPIGSTDASSCHLNATRSAKNSPKYAKSRAQSPRS